MISCAFASTASIAVKLRCSAANEGYFIFERHNLVNEFILIKELDAYEKKRQRG